MVVGDDETITADEGAGAAAVKTDGRKAEVVEPCVGEIEAVFLFDLVARRCGVEPHAFVGAGAGARGKREERGEGRGAEGT